jgi:hypothetical protein
MIEQLAELIRPWAGVWTWHTSHPLDRDRFFKAIESVFEELGGDILRGDIKQALINVTSETPATLDGPQPEATIDQFVDRALGILQYLEYKKSR